MERKCDFEDLGCELVLRKNNCKTIKSCIEDELIDYIKHRQVKTNKYTKKSVSDANIAELKTSFNYEGVSVISLNGKKLFERIVSLIIKGNDLQFQNKRFVDELTNLFRYSKSKVEKIKDGLRTACMGLPNIGRFYGNIVMKNFVSAKSEGKCITDILQHTAGIAIFISGKNDVNSFIKVNQAFQRFGLTDRKLGISHAHLNMPCEEISVKQKLAKFLRFKNEHPLLLIRYGYAEKMSYSFRRNPKEMVIKNN